MVRDCLALSADEDSGAAIASKMVMFDQDELGSIFHGWRHFFHFVMSLWTNNSGVEQGDLHI